MGHRNGVAVVASAFLAGCMQWSPFETKVDDSDRDVNATNLRRLSEHGPGTAPWSFAVLSDSHGYYDELADVVRAIDERAEVSFVVHLGDLSDDGLLVEYENALRLLRRSTVPFFVILGNHDAYSSGRDIYAQMFGATDFVVPYGKTRIVCFDSNADPHGNVLSDHLWVAAQLGTFDADTTVVLASHSDTAPDAVVSDERVRLVMYGHHHTPALVRRGGVLVRSVPAAEHRAYDRIDVTEEGVVVNACDLHSCWPLDAE